MGRAGWGESSISQDDKGHWHGEGSGADTVFFNQTGQKALAPLLLAAHLSGSFFPQVMCWVARFEEAGPPAQHRGQGLEVQQ